MPYEKADERVEQLAAKLIEAYHPHLLGKWIAYIWNTGPVPTTRPRIGKKAKLGSARRMPEKYSLLTDEGYDFIIEIKRELWDKMDLETQEALLDHELCHCGWDEDGPYIKDHDVTEFRQIIARHGFWDRDLAAFYEVSCKVADKQGKLFFEGKPEPGPQPHLEITVDLDKPCQRCGQLGSCKSGLCMKCIAERIGAESSKRRRTETKSSVH